MAGILGGLMGGGGLGGVSEDISAVVGKSNNAAANNSFNRDTPKGFWTWEESALAAGQEQLVASFTVTAGTEYAWGYGTARHEDNQGRLYAKIRTSVPADIDGTVFFTQETATGRFERYVAEYDTARLDASTSDKSQMVAFPEAVDFPTVKKDMDMNIRMDPTSGATPSESDSTVIIPVTEYDLTEGDIGRSV